MTTTVAKDEGGGSHAGTRLSGLALAAALVALVAFGAFVFHLIGQVATEEVRWTRLAWLFASVEAIAFGAAGALFGSNIQRERAERAELQATLNAEQATQNADIAAKGRALAATLQAEADTALPEAGSPLEKLTGGMDRNVVSIVIKHAALAKRLFQ